MHREKSFHEIRRGDLNDYAGTLWDELRCVLRTFEEKEFLPGMPGAGRQPAYCRRCGIRNCALCRGVDFCFECSSFPCIPVKRMDKRYRLRYQVSLIENGLRIKAIGAERFLREEKQKWTCTQCGGVVSLHSRACSGCGAVLEGMG